MSIAQSIQRARKAAGLTQKQLAEKSGLALITIQQYEYGKRRPRAGQLQALSEALGVSVYTLLNNGMPYIPTPDELPIPGADYDIEEDTRPYKHDDRDDLPFGPDDFPSENICTYAPQKNKLENGGEIKLQVETASIVNRRHHQWIIITIRDGEVKTFLDGELGSILQELTPEGIETVTTFAAFVRKREAEYFREKTLYSSDHKE